MRFKLVLSLGVGLIALLSGAHSRAQDQGQVCVTASGGSFQDALRESIFKPFEKATGIKVVEAVFQPLAKTRAMINTGNPECDIVMMVRTDYYVLLREGLLEKIDYDSINKKTFDDFPKGTVTPNGVGTFVYAKVIGFNTKHYTQENGPKSWADVWDVKKFPGPRMLDAGNFPGSPVESALLADGVSPDKLYPLDLKRAYDAMARMKPYVVKWATTGAMQPEALVSGEAFIAPSTLGRLQQAKEQGAPVDYVWNQAVTNYDYWTILKGAKNYKNAVKFIEFASRPESQAGVVKAQIVGPLNKRAFDLISPGRAKLLPTYPEHLAQAIEFNAEWWAQTDASGKSNLEKNNAMWNAFVLK
ncbi:ABC transporter substrate-binding protein [Bradyrhizobium ivorense]|uniref:ABC transporter substrate-binding protein n=1 Tax=Bradyrhizobium ivorense TaxID=2511166 RepID=UPI0010BB8985|nr:ABC transporter substrate-binding protein [Bradyrhizobium ivorense]VIO71675.1 Spermidine/putrescine-binding periplasmic protein [Bradyrhizobium ivorense]